MPLINNNGSTANPLIVNPFVQYYPFIGNSSPLVPYFVIKQDGTFVIKQDGTNVVKHGQA